MNPFSARALRHRRTAAGSVPAWLLSLAAACSGAPETMDPPDEPRTEHRAEFADTSGQAAAPARPEPVRGPTPY